MYWWGCGFISWGGGLSRYMNSFVNFSDSFKSPFSQDLLETKDADIDQLNNVIEQQKEQITALQMDTERTSIVALTQVNLDWPLVCCASGETGKLCIESHSGVSILVTAVIAAIVGHSKLLITQPSREHFQIARMNG